MRRIKYPICLLYTIFMIGFNTGCLRSQSTNTIVDADTFTISDFKSIINYGNVDDTLSSINIDFSDALPGIEIPTAHQTTSGYFAFSFLIKNKANTPKDFLYKIYYQNETYKFKETQDTANDYFQYQAENFYGSWQDSTITFRKTITIANDGAFHLITDSFKITGNPRFESKYYSSGQNEKWKRNPRVGNYEFLLAVCTDACLNSDVPNYLQHEEIRNNGIYVNPFDYYSFRLTKNSKDLAVVHSVKKLKVIANLSIPSGIFVDSSSFSSEKASTYYCATCGLSKEIAKSACFKQFKPFVLEDNYFDNIPLIADVNNDEYNRIDYYWNKSFVPQEERIHTIPMGPRTACETVKIDTSNNSIVIKNPACKAFDWRKEITGVITRHGLTYGKFIVKCKLTRLLNNQNMWNGITNAIWLISQSNESWNNRRVCKNGGYIPEYTAGENAQHIPQTAYSEIDIEVMKSQPYCPANEFPPFFKQTKAENKNINSWLPVLNDELKKDDDKIHVTCTNWDMGCLDASRYAAGCVPTKYGSSVYESFRWGIQGSRGVTGGQMENDKELFGGAYYYFEIEWNPKEIIWRVGPEKNNMHVVCYMDSSFTNIPNNQMNLIIDQEFHNTKWWYGAPYEQWNIPFPKKDIEGIIYELIVE